MADNQRGRRTESDRGNERRDLMKDDGWREEERYQEIEIFGIPGLFSNGRIMDAPKGLFRYDLRGSDDDPGEPVALERRVAVNHAASIMTAQPIALPEEGWMPIGDGLNFTGGEMTAGEFFKAQRESRRAHEMEAKSVSLAARRDEGTQTREDSPIAEMKAARENATHAQDAQIIEMPHDGFAIYQLRAGKETQRIRFEGLERIRRMGQDVLRENYDLVYAAPMASEPGKEVQDRLNELFFRFNKDERPEAFHGHSLSVSDVIALKMDGTVTCHYIDRWGFKPIDGFLAENPLRNAEMAVEDDYGMIDGINNGRKGEQERASVREKLKEGRAKAERQPKARTRDKGKER